MATQQQMVEPRRPGEVEIESRERAHRLVTAALACSPGTAAGPLYCRACPPPRTCAAAHACFGRQIRQVDRAIEDRAINQLSVGGLRPSKILKTLINHCFLIHLKICASVKNHLQNESIEYESTFLLADKTGL